MIGSGRQVCSPPAVIHVFSIFHVRKIVVLKRIIYIIYNFPVNEIGRFHNWHTRTHVHRRADHVVIALYPDNIKVRNIRVQCRIIGNCKVIWIQRWYRRRSIRCRWCRRICAYWRLGCRLCRLRHNSGRSRRRVCDRRIRTLFGIARGSYLYFDRTQNFFH